ncbi:hypothetical protein FB451DRAFT_1389717 [Mycena latifolia]|nr:hypothetical protein FB451DRAFT_1389717 [Mycena latifolia]
MNRPPPLPTRRPRSLEERLSGCAFLKFPPELRQHIYEFALGGGVISLTLAVYWPCRHFVVSSAYNEPLQDAAANELDFRVDGISTPLLLSCWQVYLEALYQHNTFHIHVNFEAIVRKLRQCIYAVTLGGRVVTLGLVASASRIKSMCHEPADDADNGPTRLDVPAEKIPIALLFACRQVYLEALPILHQRNTFHFQVDEFEVVLLAALGRYCLPDIRSVYLCRTYHSFGVPNWSNVFELLRQMGLHSLIFEFTARVDE